MKLQRGIKFSSYPGLSCEDMVYSSMNDETKRLFDLAKRITDKEDADLATTEHVRSLAAELHASRDYTDVEMEYFDLVRDILLHLRAVNYGAPDDPIVKWMIRRYGSEYDNDGQTVIYLDDTPGHICPSCGCEYETQCANGEPCGACVISPPRIYYSRLPHRPSIYRKYTTPNEGCQGESEKNI